MDVYDSKCGCPKCGEKDIYARFRQKGDRLDDCFSDPFDEARQPLIRLYCRNCGWRWSELPLDHKAKMP